MFKGDKFQKLIFCCNGFILFVLVGICSAIMADVHQSFQLSCQTDNVSEFSRLMSLQMSK